MKTIEINGKTIKTNLIENGENREYPFFKESSSISPADINIIPFHTSEREYLESKVNEGYKRVTFYRVTTRVRGFYKVIARAYR